MSKTRENWWSAAGVVALALALPIFLRGVNYLQRLLVGAETRLAAIGVDTQGILGPMPAPWRAVAQGGEEIKTFLDGNAPRVFLWRPEQIRIDHIYDQFGVVNREVGELKFDWRELDLLVDKIASTGAKPFFSLSYMPAVISSGDEVAPPKSWDEWALVVQRTIEHYSGEKGFDGLYYEVWNEPDLFGKWTTRGERNYLKLYEYAARGAQNARGVRPFKLGGPATTGLYKEWIDKLLSNVAQKNLKFDFYSWHRYDADLQKYNEDVVNIDRWLDAYPTFARVEKIVSETGFSSERITENDTRVAGAHLIAVARELMFKAKYGFNFSVTGGWGMLNKPRGEALKMLSGLGSARLSVTGEGSFVKAIAAKSEDSVQVLVVNYDPRQNHYEVVPVTFLNINPGAYVLKETFWDGKITRREVATDAATWQKELPMTPNSVVLLELSPKL